MPSFRELYDAWSLDHVKQDAPLEETMAEVYREAWKSGRLDDRFWVVNFIFFSRYSSGFDILAEAIRDDDEQIATHALILSASLVSEGCDVGPAVRTAIETPILGRTKLESLRQDLVRLGVRADDLGES